MCLIVQDIPIDFRAPEEHICNHAYFLWEKSGRPDYNFWEKAEKECDYIVCYKVLVNDYTQYSSPIQKYIWQEGWNFAKWTLVKPEIYHPTVAKGIHVFLNKEDAKIVASRLPSGFWIPVHCYKNDFIAAGIMSSNEWYVYNFDGNKIPVIVWGEKQTTMAILASGDTVIEGTLPQCAVFSKVFVPDGVLKYRKE